jgi:cobalt/nickel transport system permease protein
MSGGALSALVHPAPGSARWLAGRDPRVRVLAAGLFALTVLGLAQVPSLLWALTLALGLAAAAGLPWPLLGRRLLALEWFLLIPVLTLPFAVPGEPLPALGALAASREGLVRALVLLLKANAIAIALLALAGSLGPAAFGHALARLGVPEKLVHLLLLTVRQIHLLDAELKRLRQAMRARAFVPRTDRHTWRSLGWLIGMLLVRATERSRRVLGAMCCRGFRGRLQLLDSPAWDGADTALALALAGLCGGLLALDRLA